MISRGCFLILAISKAALQTTEAAAESSSTCLGTDACQSNESIADDSAFFQTTRKERDESSRTTLRLLPSIHDGECLYNHLPKAGGQFVKYVLKETVRPANLRFEQEGESLTQTDRQQSFTIGSVRNPCGYYVSLWAYGSGGKGPLRTSIPSSYYGVSPHLNTTQDLQRFSAWLRYIMPNGHIGLESARFVLSYFKDGVEPEVITTIQGKGKLRSMTDEQLMSIRGAAHAFDVSSVDCWIKTENLEHDLEQCLKAYQKRTGGDDIVDWHKFYKALKAEEHENKSEHQPCELYYDDANRDFVRQADKAIFEKFGYDCCAPAS